MQNPIIDALRNGAVEAAIVSARDWVDTDPDNPQAHRWLALALKQHGDNAEAQTCIERAIVLAPEDSTLHLERALLLLSARCVAEDVDAALKRSIEINPNEFSAYLTLAHMALGRSDLVEAERLARMAARVEPDHPQLAALDGMIALRRGDPDAALTVLTQASRRAPDSPDILYALGFAYYARQHWSFAEQAFRRVVERVPGTVGLRAIIAHLARRQNRPEEALDALAPLLSDPAFDSSALQRLAGESALQAEQPERALDHLKKALAQQPDDRRTLHALLMAWERLGAVDEARETLENQLKAHVQVHDLWLARLSLEPLGSEAAAAVVARWVVAMPEHVPAHEAQMRVYDFAGDEAAAEACARRIVALKPGHFSGEERIVENLMKHDPDAVEPYIEHLIEAASGPARLEWRNWLGWVQDRMQRYDSAVSAWTTVQQAQNGQQLPLPPSSTPEHIWPALAPIDAGVRARPLFLWGAPGSGVERILAVLNGSPALRVDRCSMQPPSDGFQKYSALEALVAGRLNPADFVEDWRAHLPARGIDDGNLIDWLPWWDNALLLALRPYVPEGRLLIALRDPRDMLLDWLAFGSAFPLAFGALNETAEWLATALEHIAVLHEQDLYPHSLLRLDGIEDDAAALSASLGEALGVELPVPAEVGPPRFATGHWRQYAEALVHPFERLHAVAQRLGYTAD